VAGDIEGGGVEQLWVGVDVGKEHHWVVVLDDQGQVRRSGRVANDEAALGALVGEVAGLGCRSVWAVDLTGVEAALLLTLLWAANHEVRYLPGKALNRAAAGYRSEGKTDAKDARVLADQARLRRDLQQLLPTEELVVELRLLTSRRADLVADRTRAINRLRQLLTGICPGLERAANLGRQRGWLVLFSVYQQPTAIAAAGPEALAEFLAGRGVRAAAEIAQAAVSAASAQRSRLPGEQVAAGLVAGLAAEVLDLDGRIGQLDRELQARFRRHRLAEVICSLPGMGFRLGAEFLAAVGDLASFASADQLAAYAGLAPVPNDSGKRTGRLHRPQRYHRGLRRVFYLAALTSIRCCPVSGAYYQRKRSQGKGSKTALIALARRRLNVLWAMLRDHRPYQPAGHAITAPAA
jgi:transposase